MVGVPKSTGCQVCRKRKIKCDESWPTCINCRKNSKTCPGPPEKIRWPNPTGSVCKRPTVVAKGLSKSPAIPFGNLVEMTVTTPGSGATMRKFRNFNSKPELGLRGAWLQDHDPDVLGQSHLKSYPPPLYGSPSPSNPQKLARSFVEAIALGDAGHRMSTFGFFIKDIPQRIGQNAALDAAVVCLMDAHATLVHKRTSNEIANPVLYLQAIQTLQCYLQDPQHGMSADTLCASVLLGLVEAFAGPRLGNCYLAHVGGAGRLLQLRGPQECQEPFAKEILRFNRGGIIITSIYERKPCFLTSPEWRNIAFDTTGLNFEDRLYTEVLQHMADYAALLQDLKDLDADSNTLTLPPTSTLANSINAEDDTPEPCPSLTFSPATLVSEKSDPGFDLTQTSFPIETALRSADTRAELLHKLYTFKDSLGILGIHLTAKLLNGSAALELPAAEAESPIASVYHFTHRRSNAAYNCYWSLLIMLNQLISKLLSPTDPTLHMLETQNQAAALDICKTWDDSWATKPMGTFHTSLSFVVAYPFCPPTIQMWILTGLNALLDHQHVSTFRWSDGVIRMMYGKLVGDGPDLVFSAV